MLRFTTSIVDSLVLTALCSNSESTFDIENDENSGKYALKSLPSDVEIALEKDEDLTYFYYSI